MPVPKTAITRRKSSGETGVFSLVLPGRAEHVITVRGREIGAMERQLRREAEALGAQILSRFVFAGCRHYEAVPGADEGVVWLQGDACRGGEISALQAFAVSGIRPEPIRVGGRATGFFFEDEDARYCRLTGVGPRDRTASRAAQTRAVFETAEAALESRGFRFSDTVRTWFYLDRLLEWYAEFNAVRTAFFRERGVFDRLVPASTGIGAANPAGTALIGDLLAVQPKTGAVRIEAVPSPLQSPALNYQSSFSRAAELTFPTHRHLLISGTASIDSAGKTVCVGDSAGQIELTLRVITAILQSRRMSWSDVSRGIAYFTDPRDREIFKTLCRKQGVPSCLLAMAHAAVCRDDLRFELEVDAVRT